MEVKKDLHKDVLELQEVNFQEQHQEVIDQPTELYLKPTTKNTESLLNSTSDIESGKKIGMEETGCVSERKKRIWLPIAAMICLLIIVLVAIGCTSRGNNPDAEQDVTYTTHKYRLPETDFDDCCGDEEKKRTYLEACTEKFKDDNIQCIYVTRGSAIITTRSANPNHKKIVSEKLSELKYILSHSVLNAYYYGEKEEKEENKKTQQQVEIDNLKSKVSSLQMKIEKKDREFADQKKTIEKLEKLLEDEKNKNDQKINEQENEKKTSERRKDENLQNEDVYQTYEQIHDAVKEMKINSDTDLTKVPSIAAEFPLIKKKLINTARLEYKFCSESLLSGKIAILLSDQEKDQEVADYQKKIASFEKLLEDEQNNNQKKIEDLEKLVQDAQNKEVLIKDYQKKIEDFEKLDQDAQNKLTVQERSKTMDNRYTSQNDERPRSQTDLGTANMKKAKFLTNMKELATAHEKRKETKKDKKRKIKEKEDKQVDALNNQ